MFDEVVENCLRRFGMTNMQDIYHLTLNEYNAMARAYQLRELDALYDMHRQAWLNVQAGAMKKQGSNKLVPVYKNFSSFFDYESELKKLDKKPNSRFLALSRRIKEGRENVE